MQTCQEGFDCERRCPRDRGVNCIICEMIELRATSHEAPEPEPYDWTMVEPAHLMASFTTNGPHCTGFQAAVMRMFKDAPPDEESKRAAMGQLRSLCEEVVREAGRAKTWLAFQSTLL